MSKVYFITGVNRGLGLALTQLLASNAENTVIATVRDPATVTAFASLSNVHLLMLDLSSEESLAGLDALLQTMAPDGIDCFISNAAISEADTYQPVLNVTKRSKWVDHYTINALAPVFLAQTVYPYLKKRSTKKMVFITSGAGLIAGNNGMFPSSAYGQSKAALNHAVRSLAFELAGEGFIVDAVHPGLVLSESNVAVADFLGGQAAAFIKSASADPKDAAKKVVDLVEGLTVEQSNKVFDATTGAELPW